MAPDAARSRHTALKICVVTKVLIPIAKTMSPGGRVHTSS